jgi:hypothetical protein
MGYQIQIEELFIIELIFGLNNLFNLLVFWLLAKWLAKHLIILCLQNLALDVSN